MAIKKSELYSSLWKSCDQLRGGMDASQYKDYVLVLLFMKYVSDRYAGEEYAVIHVPPGGGFADIAALKGKKDIGDKINKIIHKLAEANELKGVIDVADFNDSAKLGAGKEKQDRLSNLVAIFENPSLNFSKNRADGDDLLGDAYEYLMRHFATQSGKSKGQFYTPAEVSRIIAKVIQINTVTQAEQTLYDPTCGSGSLLIKAAAEASVPLTIYGQEMDNATRALAKMNTMLHGHPTAEIWQGNTLAAPHFIHAQHKNQLKRFNFAVANPPFSTKAWSNGFNPAKDIYRRFDGYGIPPTKNGDYAFLLHLIASLDSKGKGAIILPHGVLFRGNVEADIRKNLIHKGYIKGIIGLPPNLFYGTGIPACIIVLDKANAHARRGLFMLDASEGFIKDGNKNRLRERDIHKIVDVFNAQLTVPYYARMITWQEIEDNDYNLNIPRYIEAKPETDRHDIKAHFSGHIPHQDVAALDKYWTVYPTLKKALFSTSQDPTYYHLNASLKDNPALIKDTIFKHPDFKHYATELKVCFKAWQARHSPMLNGINKDNTPPTIITTLAEDLLQSFAPKSLLDAYDLYQHLMTYWQETMKDDVYILIEDGWQIIPPPTAKVGWQSDLLPPHIVINSYFKTEQAHIEHLISQKEALIAEQEAIIEAHRPTENEDEDDEEADSLLSAVLSAKGRISKSAITKRLKTLKNSPASQLEIDLLETYLSLLNQETKANKAIKTAQKALDQQLLTKYKTLTADELKTLIVDDKWMTTLRQTIESELDRISHHLAQRITDLATRYATPLPALNAEVESLTQKVHTHLKKMGVTW